MHQVLGAANLPVGVGLVLLLNCSFEDIWRLVPLVRGNSTLPVTTGLEGVTFQPGRSTSLKNTTGVCSYTLSQIRIIG